jgi:hypothetical protein
MKRAFWIIGGILVIALVVIQFFQSPKNTSQGTYSNDLLVVSSNLEPELREMIRNSCHDCHSNHTVYPWYGRIAPVSWMLSSHIREGKEHLNLSDWAALSDRKKISALQDMGEVVTRGEMPLKGYARLHKMARLSADQKELLIKWIDLETKRLMGE